MAEQSRAKRGGGSAWQTVAVPSKGEAKPRAATATLCVQRTAEQMLGLARRGKSKVPRGAAKQGPGATHPGDTQQRHSIAQQSEG